MPLCLWPVCSALSLRVPRDLAITADKDRSGVSKAHPHSLVAIQDVRAANMTIVRAVPLGQQLLSSLPEI